MPSSPLQRIIQWIATRLKISADGLDMLRAANSFSGLNTKTLPTELVPLNSLQLSRGVLNFTMLQSLPTWVIPYWAHQQYSPGSPAFIPRSHLGLSMNLTHRNWTGIGAPGFPLEPIVDPRGMVTPFPNGWSIDVWSVVDGQVFFPSQSAAVQQRLVDDMPIVETVFDLGNAELVSTAFTLGSCLHLIASVTSHSHQQLPVRLLFAIRPFNPEGVSLIRSLEFSEDGSRITVNDGHRVRFSREPDQVFSSVHANGDSASHVQGMGQDDLPDRTECSFGLATGFAAFDAMLAPGETIDVRCACELDTTVDEAESYPTVALAQNSWKEHLAGAAEMQTPDERLNKLYRSSLGGLMMLLDGTTITPGPFTYHQFWFRDSAYMIWALDKVGLHERTRAIVASFPRWQERSGYFRSQQGEWDSNGQALWTLWQHTELSGNCELAESLFRSAQKAVRWIQATRLLDRRNDGQPWKGLLPPGLSAEHLGLSDYYFWDDFWSIAGIEGFKRLCSRLGREKDRAHAEELALDFRKSVDAAIAQVQKDKGITAIPAGPLRDIDVGMIGSCCACYPLQLYPSDDPSMQDTTRTLLRDFTYDGLFYQYFIHSGMNPYLTLQLAHAFLYQGKRKEFWTLLGNVAARATTTMNYPEAIHPTTGGGVMGDGHHGWAAAEIILALRDAFVFESWQRNDDRHDLVFLAGLPEGWFAGDGRFFMKSISVPGGTIDIDIAITGHLVSLTISNNPHRSTTAVEWRVILPFAANAIRVQGVLSTRTSFDGTETVLTLPPESAVVLVERRTPTGVLTVP